MRLIQIIKCPTDLFYCFEQYDGPIPCSNWIEVDEKELDELERAIEKANRLDKKNSFRYILLYQTGRNHFQEIFEDADAFIKQVEKREKEEQARKEKYEKEKVEKARQRKLKQLEKLKKELGEE